jgi:adenine-specific DNA-methyltransferase
MTRGECDLAAIAGALIGPKLTLTSAEKELISHAGCPSRRVIDDYRSRIRAGQDPLGTELCVLRSPAKRRETGATYTPPSIIEAMISWAAGIDPAPGRVIDPGVGSGRFLSAAADRFPNAKLIGVDIDPLALLIARANAAVRGYAHRLQLQLGDYRSADLAPCPERTLYIGNPPYVRHHNISEHWKAWFAATARCFGFKASKLAGLHIHFFLRTRQIAKAGDYGAFITAAEWLDVNYGSTLRGILADGLGGTSVHVIDPKAQPFEDAFTTAAVTCFQVGHRPAHFSMRAVHRLEDLAPLDKGRAVQWEQMARASRWSTFLHENKERPAGFIELGELFRVHRGQVTGSNEAWIAGEMAHLIPKRFLRPTITKARELFTARAELASAMNLKRVVDLPVSLDDLLEDEIKGVRKYLLWAKTLGADASYVAQHRRAWWAVELRPPAPVLVTYMARQAPAFVRNTVRARHLNIAHGLYPRTPLSEGQLAAILVWLRRHVGMTGGRVYAGGLVKFEPKEFERIAIPALEDIDATNSADQVDDAAARGRRSHSDRHLSA